jgi:hypothetical protein
LKNLGRLAQTAGQTVLMILKSGQRRMLTRHSSRVEIEVTEIPPKLSDAVIYSNTVYARIACRPSSSSPTISQSFVATRPPWKYNFPGSTLLKCTVPSGLNPVSLNSVQLPDELYVSV